MNFPVTRNGCPQVVLLSGGLGNQFFQYSFGQYLAHVSGCRVYYDDHRLLSPEAQRKSSHLDGHRSPRLPDLLGVTYESIWNSDALPSFYFSADGGSGVSPRRMTDLFGEFGVIAETNDHSFVRVNWRYSPSLCLSEDILTRVNYWHGYWVSNIYSEFLIAETSYLSDLRNTIRVAPSDQIFIHCRNFNREGYIWNLPEEHYVAAINVIKSKVSNSQFHLFSDDPEWAISRARSWGIDDNFNLGKQSDNDIDELLAMASFRHGIVGNSSFAYLASILRPQRGMTILPKGRRNF